MAELVQTTREGDLAIVSLGRTDRSNALDEHLLGQLRSAILALADRTPRVVILHAVGPDFCIGFDLAPENPLVGHLEGHVARNDKYGLQERIGALRPALDGIARLPCPVVVAVEGRAHGAGLELALAGDFRVLGRGADLRLDGTGIGLVPFAGGITRLSRAIGRARATELVLLERSIGAEQALAWGLATRVVDDGGALDAARALALELCRIPTTALQQALLALRAAEEPPDRSFAAETQAATLTMMKHLQDALGAWRKRAWK